MKSLAEGATMLLSYVLPDAKAWPSRGTGDFDLAPFQVFIVIVMTKFLVPFYQKI